MAARGEAEAPGFSREKISFAIVLSIEGAPVDVVDLRVRSGKRLVPRLMEVPAALKRTAGIAPNRFWDKSSYVLGCTAGEGRRTMEEHAAFKSLHRELLAGSNDAGLVALLRFLEGWDPARFEAAPFVPDMLDANIVFRLDGDLVEIHGREAALALLAADDDAGARDAVFCLVTGASAAACRLHPSVKGVQGAQSSGAALVSFNLDAFTSYGKEQGANAPTSQAAAFRYGAALNRMLDRGSGNRLQRTVGDTTVAFWADASESISEESATAAERLFASWFDPAAPDTGPDAHLEEDAQEAAKLRDQLDKVVAGRPEEADPKLRKGTRFHVLGLAPNAARLSVRYWLDDEFERFAARLAEHAADLRTEPLPYRWGARAPSVARLLVKTTALAEKFDNIPPQLAGEVTRAVLEGTRYPRSWLAAAIIRLRAGDDAGTGWHAAVIRGVLERERRLRQRDKGGTADDIQAILEVPVSLQRDDPSEAYQLGRLFAALETAQRLALGRVNATIRDRYFGAASATPAGVFPLLLRGAQNHVGKLRKEHKEVWIEREIGEIVDRLPSALPRSLKLEAQGRFAIGYYHQRQAQFAGRPKLAAEVEASDDSDVIENGEGADV
jgi:CRISPR-associated protein Csd1